MWKCEQMRKDVKVKKSKKVHKNMKKHFFLYVTLFAVYFTLFVLAFFKMKQGYGLYSSKFLVQEI